MDIPHEIRKFLVGETDILTFREMYDTDPAINDFLQNLVDEIIRSGAEFPVVRYYNEAGELKHQNLSLHYFAHPEDDPGYQYGSRSYQSVRTYLTEEFRMLTHNVRTASGAWKFYQGVYDLFALYDPTVPCRDEAYAEAFSFALDAIPEYLSGGESEMYIQEHIIPRFPDTLPKGKRIKAIRAAIKEEFKSEKGYPCWLQSSEWPLGKDGKPATYIGKKKLHGGEAARFSFRDESDGRVIEVEQFY